MKLQNKDICVKYFSEGGAELLAVATKNTNGSYSLYKNTNIKDDWERISTSKNPLDFDSFVYGKKSVHRKQQTLEKSAKDNNSSKKTDLFTVKKTTKNGRTVKSFL